MRGKSNSEDSSILVETKNIVTRDENMIKHANGFETLKKLENCKVLVGSFSGSKVRCMKDDMKPSVREKPDYIMLHIRTNDLNSDREPDLIAADLVIFTEEILNGKLHFLCNASFQSIFAVYKIHLGHSAV